jgi:hypothetical protein
MQWLFVDSIIVKNSRLSKKKKILIDPIQEQLYDI